MLQLKDLKVGTRLIIPHYDNAICIIDKVDSSDDEQPIHVVWEDGTATWPEQQFVCENTIKL